MPIHTIITRDGVRIAYHDVGSGDPAIVFIHGGFGCQEEYFSPGHRCIAVDLRGHGESGKPDVVYTMEQHGDDVAELIRQLGLEKPGLVGQSMGGQVIISAAPAIPSWWGPSPASIRPRTSPAGTSGTTVPSIT